MELVSVIVPAYNNAPWLPRCLDSLLAQTYPNIEIIVVNDGSSDDTGTVLDDYAEKYRNIRAIHQENGGVTSARLRGAAAAGGGFIGFVDGDDEVEPQMYEDLVSFAEDRGADISHCGQQILFPDGRVTKVTDSGEMRIQDHLGGLQDLLDGSLIEPGLCTKLYRRELFEGLEDWMDPSVRNNEDLLMNFYLFSRAQTSVFRAVCPYHYILRRGSASYGALNARKIFDPIRVREKILESCEEALKQDARRALMRNLLFAYAQLAMEKSKEFEEHRRDVRKMLKEQSPYFSLLSARNRILAGLICKAPWAFTLAYKIYVALFQREEQH